ncbi:MAG: Gfo/Idh/MocA family protein [Acidimicrobiales bacterium]
MRVGVVGCGYWGSKHVRVLHGSRRVDEVAVIDQNPSIRAELGRVFPSVNCFEDVDEALEHVDALIIATPPTSHASLATRAMTAGKHVLVEKPLATSTADAAELIRLSELHGVTLMVGHTFEYNAAVQMLRDIVASGDLGKIHYMDSARLNLGLYQSDVDVIWDLAPHDISIANYVLGSEPTAVQAWGSAHANDIHLDVASIRLEYGHLDVSTTVRISWLDPLKVRRSTVVGTKKMAVYNDMNDGERIKLYDRGVDVDLHDDTAPHAVPLTYRYGGVVSPYVDFKEPLQTMVDHFVESIINGTMPQSDGLNGLRVVRILEAAHESIKRASRVELDASPEQLVPTLIA